MRMRGWIAAALLASVPGAAAAGSVVTYHNSIHRDGAYVIPQLTQAAAANMHRDTGFNASVSGHIYAQPLFWKPSDSGSGLVIVATESNAVYALDEATGATVWQKQLDPSVPLSQLPCGNIDPSGITGTPVIDPVSGRLYLDALTKAQDGPRHMIYALSLSDGSIVSGWPLDVQAALAAQGVTFSSSTQGERSALLFFRDALYVNYGGNAGDCGSYKGTVLQFQTDPPALTGAWQTRANGGGIWAQGGIAGDGEALFVTTGNTFGASKWSDGEAIIKLRPGLAHSNSKKDYFAPSNWQDLDNSDQDLGGTEALPLNIAVSGQPSAKRVIAFGKDGKAYLVDRRDLGGIGGQIQSVQVASGAIRTAPAIYQTDSQTMVAFTNSGSSHCSGSNVTMLNVAASGGSPISFAWCAKFSGGGAPIVTTTDGVSEPIVWVVGAEGDNLLHGFNGLNGQTVFGGSGTSMSSLHHFQTILATRKRFYVAGDNNVYAFSFR
jgi:PQQ enzyme-like repeat protein